MGFKGVCRVSVVLLVFVVCAYQCLLSTVQQFEWSPFKSMGYALLCLMFSILSAACIDIIHMNPADSLTWPKLLDHYGWYTLEIIAGWWYFQRMTEEAKDIKKQQDRELMDIINLNRNTDYGKDHGVDKVTCSEEFRKNVPFGSIEIIQGYMERVKEGDSRAFTNDNVLSVCYTSGTTGIKKYWPLVETAPREMMKAAKEYAIYRRVGRSMGRSLMMMHHYNPIKPEPGKPVITTMSSEFYRHRKFWITPRAVFEICQETSYLYACAVFAMRDPELDSMKTIFASMMFSFWVVINGNWRKMCDDIERGYIERGTLQVDDKALAKINAHLTPDPKRAKKLRTEFNRGLFRIAKRIWPRLQYVDMVCTGSLAHPADLLKENQMYGIPFFSLHVAATEVLCCMNTDESFDEYVYTLFPRRQYYEWIAEENISEDNPQTLETIDLEVGKSYEMVCTTRAGLTRFRTGDIMECVDKFNQLPVFVYCYRHGTLLNIVGEKISENIFYESLMSTCQELKVQLIDYTVTGNISMSKVQAYIDKYEDPLTARPKYLLFCEFSQNGKKVSLSKEDKKKFDATLRRIHQYFDQVRRENYIGEMDVFQVKQGGFQALKSLMIKETQTQQFKMPRVISNPDHLEFILTQTEQD